MHIICIFVHIIGIFPACFLHIRLIQSIYIVHILCILLAYLTNIVFAYFRHINAYFVHIICISCIFLACL